MKVSNQVPNHHMNDTAFYYPTSLIADTTNSLPSPPSSFYDKSSNVGYDSFCDDSAYNNTTTPSTTDQDSQPQNYTIDHSFHSLSPTAPTLSTSFDSNSDVENMTIRHSPKNHYQPSAPMPSMNSQHQVPTTNNRFELNYTNLSSSEADLRSCHECGKIYKHPSCLYKHLWEHSEGWELTSRLPLTKHQQVQILEAATILIGMSTKPKQTTASLSSSSSSCLVDIQSVDGSYDDGACIDLTDNDQDAEMADDGSDIISIVDDDDDPSSF